MEIQSKFFDKILILNLSGSFTKADVEFLDTKLLPAQGADVGWVVLSLGAAAIDPLLSTELIKVRDKHKKGKPKYLLASSVIAGADAKDLVGALDLVNTGEADRIVEIFSLERELSILKSKAAELDLAASKKLRESLKMPDSETPLTSDEFTVYFAKFVDLNKKLIHLYKIWGTEIDQLRKQRVQCVSEDSERLESVKNSVLNVLKKKLSG